MDCNLQFEMHVLGEGRQQLECQKEGMFEGQESSAQPGGFRVLFSVKSRQSHYADSVHPKY